MSIQSPLWVLAGSPADLIEIVHAKFAAWLRDAATTERDMFACSVGLSIAPLASPTRVTRHDVIAGTAAEVAEPTGWAQELERDNFYVQGTSFDRVRQVSVFAVTRPHPVASAQMASLATAARRKYTPAVCACMATLNAQFTDALVMNDCKMPHSSIVADVDVRALTPDERRALEQLAIATGFEHERNTTGFYRTPGMAAACTADDAIAFCITRRRCCGAVAPHLPSL